MSSDPCANCSCADKSQCTKKGNSSGLEMVETSSHMSFEYEMETVAAENDCKCGPNCKCNGCTCHN